MYIVPFKDAMVRYRYVGIRKDMMVPNDCKRVISSRIFSFFIHYF